MARTTQLGKEKWRDYFKTWRLVYLAQSSSSRRVSTSTVQTRRCESHLHGWIPAKKPQLRGRPRRRRRTELLGPRNTRICTLVEWVQLRFLRRSAWLQWHNTFEHVDIDQLMKYDFVNLKHSEPFTLTNKSIVCSHLAHTPGQIVYSLQSHNPQQTHTPAGPPGSETIQDVGLGAPGRN